MEKKQGGRNLLTLDSRWLPFLVRLSLDIDLQGHPYIARHRQSSAVSLKPLIYFFISNAARSDKRNSFFSTIARSVVINFSFSENITSSSLNTVSWICLLPGSQRRAVNSTFLLSQASGCSVGPTVSLSPSLLD
jgi:hypothetical protein